MYGDAESNPFGGAFLKCKSSDWNDILHAIRVAKVTSKQGIKG